MVEPIKPATARVLRDESIPDAVIEAVNHLIVKNMRGGRSVILQRELVGEIQSRVNGMFAGYYKTDYILSNGWLNFEPLFRKAGWDVHYDKPGYNETYDAYYTFTERLPSQRD